jgi:hypothetical protein
MNMSLRGTKDEENSQKSVIAMNETPPLSLRGRFDQSNLFGSGQASQSQKERDCFAEFILSGKTRLLPFGSQ